MADEYPWVRRESERGPAYAAFREYLQLGARRTIKDAAAAASISYDSAKELYARHDWKARAVAYDQHVATAETDGFTSQVASAKSEDMELADKLRSHLSNVLDDHIRDREPPTVRWSQGLGVLIRLEEHVLRMEQDDPKKTAARDRVDEYLRRIEEASSQ